MRKAILKFLFGGVGRESVDQLEALLGQTASEQAARRGAEIRLENLDKLLEFQQTRELRARRVAKAGHAGLADIYLGLTYDISGLPQPDIIDPAETDAELDSLLAHYETPPELPETAGDADIEVRQPKKKRRRGRPRRPDAEPDRSETEDTK